MKKLACLLPLLLVACQAPIVQGKITNKVDIPARDWTTHDPVYMSRTNCFGYGKNKSCSTTQYVAYYATHHHHLDESWEIVIHGCNNDRCADQTYQISQQDFNKLKIGDAYDRTANENHSN